MRVTAAGKRLLRGGGRANGREPAPPALINRNSRGGALRRAEPGTARADPAGSSATVSRFEAPIRTRVWRGFASFDFVAEHPRARTMSESPLTDWGRPVACPGRELRAASESCFRARGGAWAVRLGAGRKALPPPIVPAWKK